jgi:3-keto-disaccharide hydrolase
MRCWLLALGLVIVLSGALQADDEAGFVPLFDTRSFDGWEGNLKIFRIEDGAIVGGTLKERNARNEFLCTKDDFGDFELRLKFKVLGKLANAGVQFRSRRIPNHYEVKGYQADLGDGWWGSLYDESRRNKILVAADKGLVKKVLKHDDWNDYTIRCQGPRIQLWINGAQTVDYTEPDQGIEQTGLIGLQIHGGLPSEAWYKDIRIKRL